VIREREREREREVKLCGMFTQIETIHGREISAPAVIFVIPPPDKLAVSAIERLAVCN